MKTTLDRRRADEMAQHAGQAAQLLRCLANPHRLRVLCTLAGGERSVGQINDAVDLSQSALSQHLAVLRRERLVHTRRKGQAVYYRLAPGPATAVIGTLHAVYCPGA